MQGASLHFRYAASASEYLQLCNLPLATLDSMDENENYLRITEDDINTANQLSSSCPICAGAVENYVRQADLVPVMCAGCNTLYHKTCWNQNGNKCAILGCGHKKFTAYGGAERMITINMNEIPSEAVVGRRNKRLKQIERQREALGQAGRNDSFWGNLIDSILRALGLKN